ncbi:GNAT family N-acetyltransferase [Halomonas sp. MCCC 1A17488]|uniref:GNAT family N-acetyltransferase n=1 Tax=Billgrantia sulfidoxydans TaxID=2733484 RepID=A0ABX7W222_9GAMM|nr:MULTISPECIES: GNAT family N-acetyltransferase [Halomonas]MCE8016479.1 GNAT family N-acetyltransferase [Halomonas sp. MCCC 1A17488]MCG3239812.1 GNAT family N-acetyltransferase [Halomonas sp. MCCC 1A17488]QPP50287.1 GNAT family N-acetyltransferase [Halomonas sp. SS10-MC5]QTP53906.1 GNAT family N-acetyltransferase [Halomonas sulfidoxydans]
MPVRPATLDDLEPLSALLDGYRQFYRQEPNLEGARRFLQARLSRGDSHVLVHEGPQGELQGFVQLYPLLSTVRLAPLWLLNDLFVSPEARRSGVGRALMQAARELAESHGVAHLKLATEITNRTAQALYESLGWQRDTTFYHYGLLFDSQASQG